MKSRSLTLTALLVVASASVSHAEEKRFVVRTRAPKPSFRITPLTQEFSARPGQDLPFEFTVEATNDDVALEVSTVGLNQKINGVILADDTATVKTKVRLLSDGKVIVRKGESKTVKGRWQLPPGGCGYHTAGVTMTDVSREELDPTRIGHGSGASVRFLTRYLLRMDATVNGGANERSVTPQMVSGALVEQAGRAVATVLLQADELHGGVWNVEGQIHSAAGPIGKPFKMRLPSRSRMPAPAGDKVQLLAGSRVLVMAPIAEPLFEGEYQLEVVVSRGGMHATKQSFDLIVQEGDFPAQKSVVAQVVEQVEVSPSQIELSTTRGGSRIVPLTLANRSEQPIDLRLRLEGAAGDSQVDWLRIRPESFSLRPRSKRQVMVAVQGGGRQEQNQYASLIVEVAPTETVVGGEHRLPVGLLVENEPSVEWRLGDPQWMPATASSREAAIEMALINQGGVHLAPHASMKLVDSLDREVTTEAGFGKWIVPGATGLLRFTTPDLPPGDYRLSLEFTPVAGGASEMYSYVLAVAP